MCDTCNVPLNIAESDRADQERAAIRRLIAQGLTKQQILAELKQHLRARDPGQAAGQRLQPRGLVGAGGGRAGLVALLAALLPRWRRRGRDRSDDRARARAPALSAADERRLDEDLARYDV